MSSVEPLPDSQEAYLPMQRSSASSFLPFSLQNRPPSRQPATVYVQSLGKGSQRTMQGALFSLVQLMLPEQELGGEAICVFPWEHLRFEHTTVLRARLAERYKPSTANKHIAALRGVLKAAWQLELMTAEDYHKAASIKTCVGPLCQQVAPSKRESYVPCC
jgi:hypothetical protein